MGKPNATQKSVRPFGMRDKLGYMFGDFGNDFTFILSSSFLMKFYTDVMGVPGTVVGFIMMAARIVDAFTDVGMGRICDTSKMTPVGKFKPWIRRMCGPVAIASFLIYQSAFAGMGMTFKIVWLFVTYILWGSIFYTSINIPYGSMASAVSAEPGDRQSLSTFRTIGGTLAGLVIGAGVPMVAYDTINGNKVLSGSRFTIIAGVFSILAVGCYLLCYHLTTERVKPEPDPNAPKFSIGNMLKSIGTNRALLSIIVISILMLLAQLTSQSMGNYVFPNYYGNPTAQSLATMVTMVIMFACAAIAKPLAVKFGKRELSIFGAMLSIASYVVLFFLRPENVWVYVIVNTVAYLGLGIFSMVSWALITDVIDYSELKNGVREDGTVYAVYSFARKMGQAASAGLTGVLLGMIGYSAATAFDAPVLTGIYNIAVLVPALAFALVVLCFWFWYPLDKKTVEENVAKLKEKHGN